MKCKPFIQKKLKVMNKQNWGGAMTVTSRLPCDRGNVFTFVRLTLILETFPFDKQTIEFLLWLARSLLANGVMQLT